MKKSEFYLLADSFLRLLKFTANILMETILVIPGLCLLIIGFVFKAIEMIFHYASNSLISVVGRILLFVFRH